MAASRTSGPFLAMTSTTPLVIASKTPKAADESDRVGHPDRSGDALLRACAIAASARGLASWR